MLIDRKLSELENQTHFNEKKLSAEGSKGKFSALKVASFILGNNTTPIRKCFLHAVCEIQLPELSSKNCTWSGLLKEGVVITQWIIKDSYVVC